MKKLYSVEVTIAATMYLCLDEGENPNEIAKAFADTGIEVPNGCVADGLEITGCTYNPDMPHTSLSPAMTILSVDQAEFEEDLTEEFDCGQCEGTGTTQSASNLEEEECPVCDGGGRLER